MGPRRDWAETNNALVEEENYDVEECPISCSQCNVSSCWGPDLDMCQQSNEMRTDPHSLSDRIASGIVVCCNWLCLE